jgi:hypothetical protein
VQDRPLHQLLERARVRPEALRGLLVQGVIGIWVEEEELQAVDHGGDGEDGLPVLAEDVEADVAVEVDVGVVDLFVVWGGVLLGLRGVGFFFPAAARRRARVREGARWIGSTHLGLALDLGRIVRVARPKGEVEEVLAAAVGVSVLVLGGLSEGDDGAEARARTGARSAASFTHR